MRGITIFAVAATISLTTGVYAQSQDTPRFETASIKPSPAPNGMMRTPMAIDPAQVTYNGLSPRLLVQIAYEQPEWGVVGGPKWFDSDRYDIAAKLPPDSSTKQIPKMLQDLLAERFHLIIGRQTKIMPVYVLTIAKGGPKLKPGDLGEQWKGGVMKGGIFRGRIDLHQLTMGGLAEVLATQLGRPVIDKTQLSGVFDIGLKWAPDDKSNEDALSNDPSLYTAITEQLGLKLESSRMPVQVLVISSIQRPSEN